jgi:hypothetical protein
MPPPTTFRRCARRSSRSRRASRRPRAAAPAQPRASRPARRLQGRTAAAAVPRRRRRTARRPAQRVRRAEQWGFHARPAPGAAARRCGRPMALAGIEGNTAVFQAGDQNGACNRRNGRATGTDAGAAGHLFAQPRPAHGAGHRGPQRRGAARYAELQVQAEARRVEQDAGLPARLRRGLAAPVSRPAAREPARRQGQGAGNTGSGRRWRSSSRPTARRARSACSSCRRLGHEPSTSTWSAAARTTRASASGPRRHRPGAGARPHHHAQPRRRPLAVARPARRSARRGARGERPMAAPAVAAIPRRIRCAGAAARRRLGAALAQEVPPPAYQLAAQRAGIPSTVLYAVALQESGIRLQRAPDPLAVDAQRRRPARSAIATRAEACAGCSRRSRPRRHRIDAGLGQVNLGYHAHRYTSPATCWTRTATSPSPRRSCGAAHPGRGLAAGHRPLPPARRRRARRPLPAQCASAPARVQGRGNRRGPRRSRPSRHEPHPPISHHAWACWCCCGLPSGLAAPPPKPLIVVEDRGGTSALPYYQP